MDTQITSCPLCKTENEDILFSNSLLRVIWVENSDFPGFCRVIANEHMSEIIDLPIEQQQAFMHIVFTVAHTQRVYLNPDKINLASLGNQVPHLHWHVIPRWKTDAYFPNSIWSEKVRDGSVPISATQTEQLKTQLKSILSTHK